MGVPGSGRQTSQSTKYSSDPNAYYHRSYGTTSSVKASICHQVAFVVLGLVCCCSLAVSLLFANRLLVTDKNLNDLQTKCSGYELELDSHRQSVKELFSKVTELSGRFVDFTDEPENKDKDEVKLRRKRSFGGCQCPSGPPGPKGEPGDDGRRGRRGKVVSIQCFVALFTCFVIAAPDI
ncbi:uncharacterized protein LOC144748830 [Ciona intestinalis]